MKCRVFMALQVFDQLLQLSVFKGELCDLSGQPDNFLAGLGQLGVDALVFLNQVEDGLLHLSDGAVLAEPRSGEPGGHTRDSS